MRKGVSLPANTVVIILIVIAVLVAMLYFFSKGAVLPMGSATTEAQLQRECSDWRLYGFDYEKYITKVDNGNYTALSSKFGSPVSAKLYCQGDIDSKVVGCSNSNCTSPTPLGWSTCCCNSYCDGKDCSWSKSCT